MNRNSSSTILSAMGPRQLVRWFGLLVLIGPIHIVKARKHLLLTIAAMATGVVAHAGDPLTLDQAVALALENNRGLQSSLLDGQKAQDRLDAARTRQFPGISVYMLGAQQLRSFDFTLEKGVLGTYQATGPLPEEDVHLKTPLEPTGLLISKVTQPLSALIRIRRSMDTLRTGVKLANEQTRAERQKLAREIKRVYYGLQQVEASLRSVRETANLYEEVEKLTSRYVLQQVALRGDLLQTQTQLAKTQQLETQLTNQQAGGKEQLNQLLGRNVLTEFEVQPVLEATGELPALEEARVRALRDRPEVRQAQLRSLQAEQDLRAKKAEYIPDIAIEFNSLMFLNWGRYMPTQTTSIGVSLSWEPFDWGRRKHEAAEKQRSVAQAQIARQETENSVLVDINDKHRELRYRRAELRVARLSQETAVETLRVMKNRYSAQAALVKDVLQAQAGLAESNTEYQQALTSFWNARADFERAIGEDQ
jgi:outer membrane protein TolC